MNKYVFFFPIKCLFIGHFSLPCPSTKQRVRNYFWLIPSHELSNFGESKEGFTLRLAFVKSTSPWKTVHLQLNLQRVLITPKSQRFDNRHLFRWLKPSCIFSLYIHMYIYIYMFSFWYSLWAVHLSIISAYYVYIYMYIYMYIIYIYAHTKLRMYVSQ